MQGNGQAQNAIFHRHTALAQPTPPGYPISESAKKPLGNSTFVKSRTKPGCLLQKSLYSMTAEHSQSLPFSTALLLVNTEANASVDKRALRHAGVDNVRVLTSGLVAVRLLAGLLPPNSPENVAPLPEVVLCHSNLADMRGADFVALVRNHPQLLDLPIITMASNDDEAHKISSLAAGYSALLVRPYAPAQLRDTLLQAARNANDAEYLRNAAQNIKAGDFDKALAQYTLLGHGLGQGQEDPEQAFQDGMLFLKERQWDHAIRAFQKAMRRITLKGESELGLATAWKGKGDLERYRHYLGEASHTFARALQWHKARSVYARLLAADPQAISPFVSMAERFIRESRFEEATTALAAGYDLNPQTPVARALARACLCTDAPDYAAQRVEASLRQTDMESLASQLGQQIRESIVDEEQKMQERQRSRQDESTPYGADSTDMELALPRIPNSERTRAKASGRTPSRTGERGYTRGDNSQSRKGIPLNESGPDTQPGASPSGTGKSPVLAPLNPEDAESTLFSSMPGLNEALSVAKFTWKLFHATRKMK